MKQFFEKNGFWLLLSTAVVAVALCVVSFFSTNTSFLRDAVNTALSPFRAGISAVATWVEEKHAYFGSYTALEEENQALKNQLARLEEQLRDAQDDSEENRRLRQLLNLRQQHQDLVFEDARIISQSTSNWESTLTLNRGSDHGVEVNDCVITEQGYLVGVVSECGGTWCRVLTVIDSEMSIGAENIRTGALCMAAGSFPFMLEGRLSATYLDSSEETMVGDLIVTSGLGGYYPAGLVIGAVSEIRADDSGLALSVALTPRAELGSLKQVFIIKEFSELS